MGRLLEKFKLQLCTSKADAIVASKAEINSLNSKVTLLDSVIKAVKSENSSLAIGNRYLKLKNESLMRKVVQIEQYSRANNFIWNRRASHAP